MSVTVRHLNADSTFLLTFIPVTGPSPHKLKSTKGTFTVLIDPWLSSGSSIVSAKWFAITDRVEPSAIKHISEIPEPDMVVISQNKPDHCHKDTLLQFNPTGKTIIAAEPSAARAIKSWDHFDPSRVFALDKFDAKDTAGNTLRFRIPALGTHGTDGEIAIAFIPARNYVTGLHNAFGITYQAPTVDKAKAGVATFRLKDMQEWQQTNGRTRGDSNPDLPSMDDRPNRPIQTKKSMPELSFSKPQVYKHRPQLSRSSNTASSELLSFDMSDLKPTEPKTIEIRSSAIPHFDFEAGALFNTSDFVQALPTPPQSPETLSSLQPKTSISSVFTSVTADSSQQSSFSSPASTEIFNTPMTPFSPTLSTPRPKAISILYTPHGIPLADLQPYIQSHLLPLPGALPLTCLLHSFTTAANPWWFGGKVLYGALGGGIDIAKHLLAKCWISAHDEEKRDRGVAVKLLKVGKVGEEEVRRALEQEGVKRDECNVLSLAVGAQITLVGGRGEVERQRIEKKNRENYGGIGLGFDLDSLMMGNNAARVEIAG